MTLNEAINHAQEKADHYKELLKTNNNGWGFLGDDTICIKYAQNQQQLADWLRELREYKNDYIKE